MTGPLSFQDIVARLLTIGIMIIGLIVIVYAIHINQ